MNRDESSYASHEEQPDANSGQQTNGLLCNKISTPFLACLFLFTALISGVTFALSNRDSLKTEDQKRNDNSSIFLGAFYAPILLFYASSLCLNKLFPRNQETISDNGNILLINTRNRLENEDNIENQIRENPYMTL